MYPDDYSLGWPIIVTAPNANARTMNTVLLRMLDYGDQDEAVSNWVVLRDTKVEQELSKPTRPPVIDQLLAHNDFAGYSMTAVDGWLRDKANAGRLADIRAMQSTCLVIDAKGLATGTVVVLDTDALREDEENPVDTFLAIRMPADQAPLCMCNLEIANMNLIEFANEEAGRDEDGVLSFDKSLGDKEVSEQDHKTRGDIALELAEKNLLEDLPQYNYKSK